LPDEQDSQPLDQNVSEEGDIQAMAASLRAGLDDRETNPYLHRLVGAAMGDEAAISPDQGSTREPALAR